MTFIASSESCVLETPICEAEAEADTAPEWDEDDEAFADGRGIAEVGKIRGGSVEGMTTP